MKFNFKTRGLVPSCLLMTCVLVLELCGTTPAMAQTVAQESATSPARAEASVKPGINKPFLDPNLKVEEWLARFEVESREIYAAREEILSSLELHEGMTAADIGAGTGLFTLLMSQRVGPQGWVYAVEISPRFAEHLGQLAVEHKLVNVSPLLCSARSVRLPRASVDLAFLCDVYHHFEYPSSSLTSIHRALRDDGQLVVIDFKRIEGESREWIMGHVRAGQETVQQEVEAAGFELVRELQLKRLSENYFLVFRKKL